MAKGGDDMQGQNGEKESGGLLSYDYPRPAIEAMHDALRKKFEERLPHWKLPRVYGPEHEDKK